LDPKAIPVVPIAGIASNTLRPTRTCAVDPEVSPPVTVDGRSRRDAIAYRPRVEIARSMRSSPDGHGGARIRIGEAVEDLPTTKAEWRERLTPQQYRVLRRAATELPFSGEYVRTHEDGTYHCAGCEAELFSSQAKFDSGTGWPSFSEPLASGAVTLRRDWKMIVPRTEVRCGRCGSHLGHVFFDGPSVSGLRYCINSIALDLKSGGGSAEPER
jgi:peptide-methionine (R)-S-oxide reductase